MPTFKYGEELDIVNQIEKCPCEGSISTNMRGYRFGFSDLTHEDNCIPQSEKFKREGRTRTFKKNQRCNFYGLSMYTSEEKALFVWNEQFNDKLRDNLKYTKLFYIDIEESDGVVTPPDGNDHFDLHEFTGANLIVKIKFIKNL